MYSRINRSTIPAQHSICGREIHKQNGMSLLHGVCSIPKSLIHLLANARYFDHKPNPQDISCLERHVEYDMIQIEFVTPDTIHDRLTAKSPATCCYHCFPSPRKRRHLSKKDMTEHCLSVCRMMRVILPVYTPVYACGCFFFVFRGRSMRNRCMTICCFSRVFGGFFCFNRVAGS